VATNPVETRRPTAVDWPPGRRLALDNLKTLLIAGIIAVHGVMGYAGTDEWWSYADVQETTLSPVVEVVLLVAVVPLGLLLMPLFFLLGGLMSVPSLGRKGPGRFLRDRTIRLGVPFLFYVLLVQPAVLYALYHPLGNADGSYWFEILGSERQLDTGPLWFVGVLLVFSGVYAAWSALPRDPGRPPAPLTIRRLTWMVLAVVLASFLVRTVYPYGGDSGFLDLNYWEGPACAAVFALGIAGARQGWAAAVPTDLWRQSRRATLVVGAVLLAFLVPVGWFDAIDAALGGWNWVALVFAALEGALAVFGAVWLLGAAQRHLDRSLPLVGPAARRATYGAFMVQTPVLIGIAVLLRPVPVPAEVKALVVVAGGIAASFALAWLMLRHLPGLRRVL
jgi:hypothetical protein